MNNIGDNSSVEAARLNNNEVKKQKLVGYYMGRVIKSLVKRVIGLCNIMEKVLTRRPKGYSSLATSNINGNNNSSKDINEYELQDLKECLNHKISPHSEGIKETDVSNKEFFLTQLDRINQSIETLSQYKLIDVCCVLVEGVNLGPGQTVSLAMHAAGYGVKEGGKPSRKEAVANMSKSSLELVLMNLNQYKLKLEKGGKLKEGMLKQLERVRDTLLEQIEVLLEERYLIAARNETGAGNSISGGG